ncbi:MAG TPA: O-antigen ligase family protein, partial [bacterium]|nr:O-antigen ligase family protein [bacterium]
AWGGTRSRGAFLALAVCLVLYLFTHYAAVEARLRRFNARQWAVFAGLALFMLACSAFMIDRLLEGEKIDPRAGLRPTLWASAFHMACDQPFFGTGPGTFETVYPYYRSPDLWNTTTPFAHNELLQAAAECGWPACALLLAFTAALFWNSWRLARVNPPFKALAPPRRAAETALLMLTYVFLQNLVDFTFHAWSILLPLTAWMAFALRDERVGGVEVHLQLTKTARLASAWAVFALAFWVLGIGAWRDAAARLDYYAARGLQAQGSLDQAGKELERSLSLRPNLVEPWSLLGAMAMSRAVTAGDPAVKSAYFRLAETDFEQAVKVSPRSVTPRENLVKLMEVQGRLDQALDLQEDLTGDLPGLPTNYLEQGEILLAQGRPAAVLPLVQKAINLDHYFLEAYFLKAKALEALGRPAQARQVYRDVEAKLRSAGLQDKIPLVENEVRRLKDRP